MLPEIVAAVMADFNAERETEIPHTFGDTYEADTVIYIENRVGRFSFHVKSDDPELAGVLMSPPRSERGWSGVSMQARARQIALDWLAEQAAEERLPFDIHDQR